MRAVTQSVTTRPPKRAWVEQIMGMPISIHLRGAQLDSAATAAAVARTFDDLRRVDDLFSTWKPGSQVSRLQRGELTLAAADPLVRDVVRLCEEARVGHRRLVRCEAARTVRAVIGSTRPAWSRAGRCSGRARACPPRCPSTTCWSTPAATSPSPPAARTAPAWRLGIENPSDSGRLLDTVELRSGGLATSGTAARGHHIVSPRTGAPATELAAVSVAGPSLMWADVYATAALARGPDCVGWLGTLTDHTWLVVGADGTVLRP